MNNRDDQAAYLDSLIFETKDDGSYKYSIDEIVVNAIAKGKKQGKLGEWLAGMTKGTVKAHIRFRLPSVTSLKQKQRLTKLLQQ